MSNVFASMVISVKRAGFKKHKVICHFLSLPKSRKSRFKLICNDSHFYSLYINNFSKKEVKTKKSDLQSAKNDSQ